MKTKEKLEEIKTEYEWHIENELLPRTSDDNFEWLIKQAERVQELEADNYNMDVELEKLYKQNKRYREAIEFGIGYLKNSDIRQVQLVVTALKSTLEESE